MPAGSSEGTSYCKADDSRGMASLALGQFRYAARLKLDGVSALDAAACILATHPAPDVRHEAEAIRLAEHAAELTEPAAILRCRTHSPQPMRLPADGTTP